MSVRVLVVEDEPRVRRAILALLERDGYDVEGAATAAEAEQRALLRPPDAVLLDLLLPDGSGLDVCRGLRDWSRAPILVLSAVGDEREKIACLDAGADDYVTKPYAPGELLARLRAVLRRYQVQATLPERDSARRAFRFAGWELNLRTRRLTSPEGIAVELSNGEFSLLSAFCRAPQRVLSREQLLSMSRLHEAEVYDRTVDSQIRRLRTKIERDAALPALVVTERGSGYRFATDVESLY